MPLTYWLDRLIAPFRRREAPERITIEYTKKDGTVICFEGREKSSFPTEAELLTMFDNCSFIQAGESQYKVCLERNDYIVLVMTETESFVDFLLYGEYQKETDTYHFYFAKQSEVVLSKANGQPLFDELKSKPKVPPKFISYRAESETDQS
ncbi:hypothetical protein [Shewanella kaireitica]|uniref:hypothetical protein n=1 Tax=Shewanella kaireitica TaxID=212021 RepID=UPI00200FC108|nr:hypothetical protein [Shewanella kaireitica]MCL1093657.1 hypothetical protein [Shewanella kaireitica]